MASAKGGSGKTSLTATFGTFLSRLQKKVLLIDADPATNGLTLLYLKEVRVKAELVHSLGRAPAGLHETLSHELASPAPMCDVVSLTEFLDLIPATFELHAMSRASTNSMRTHLQGLLAVLREQYDFILIDAQAGADEIAQIAMSRKISDEVVIVSEYDPMSAAGVERLKALLREDLTYDRTWVLLNKILPEFAKSFGDFLEVARYLSPIPWDAEVVRAYARRRLAIDAETANAHTLAIIQTLKSLFGDSIQKELANWIQTRAAIIRQPIEQQYLDAEKEMAYLLSRRAETERRKRFSTLLRITILSTFISVILTVFLGENVYTRLMRSDPALAVAILLAMSITLIFAFNLSAGSQFLARVFRSKLPVEGQLDEARVNRQMDVLEAQLRRLEMLRAMDPETLLRRREADSSETAL